MVTGERKCQIYFISDMLEKKTFGEDILPYTYPMKGSKLLAVSQERDPRVIVDSLLGMLDVLDVLAKTILKKKPR